MESLSIHGTPYRFSSSIREDKFLRDSFNQLTQLTFGFDFSAWHKAGLWTDRYQPHCLVADGQVAANISVNRMDFCWEGSPLSMIQLGTVMTHPDFRGKGLSRYLMERILQVYEGTVDLIYLFANHTVLEFYPKFGFSPVEETIFSREMPAPSKEAIRRVDAGTDFPLLLDLVRRGKPQGVFPMAGNRELSLFHLLGPYRDSLYLLPNLDALAVAEYREDSLFLWEVFSPKELPISRVLAAFSRPGISRAILGFPPNGLGGYALSPLPGGDDMLFVQGPRRNSSKNGLSGFPPFPTHDAKKPTVLKRWAFLCSKDRTR